MAIPQTIFHPDQLERRVAEGWLRRQRSGNLQIFNYTEATQYGRKWDKYTRACRGLILDAEYNLVALPFEKFFNVGEADCPALPEGREVSFEAYEKVDGSLGIWFFHEGEWRVATRGSFDNDYTAWAYQHRPDLTNFPMHWTVMTEICMPADLDGMPRAVKHEPGVYYLGATDLYSIQGLNNGDVCPSTTVHLWKGPIAGLLPDAASIDELTHKAKHHKGTEGWVIRYRTGLRVKVKTAWYLQIFRAISTLNEKHVKELMLKAGLDEWLKDFPEELQDEARAIYDGIQGRFVTRREAIMRDFARLQSESFSMSRDYRENRKAFALAVKDHGEKSYLFALYDGNTIDAKLLAEC
jgi:RNA ligase